MDRIQARATCGVFDYLCPVSREIRPLVRIR